MKRKRFISKKIPHESMPGRSTKNKILNHTRGNVFRKGLDYAVILKRDVKALYLAGTQRYTYNIKTNQSSKDKSNYLISLFVPLFDCSSNET